MSDIVQELRDDAKVAEEGDYPEDACRWAITMRQAADDIERLRKIEAAAKNVSDTLEGGFIVCRVCGDQETTSDIDFAAELRAALNPK